MNKYTFFLITICVMNSVMYSQDTIQLYKSEIPYFLKNNLKEKTELTKKGGIHVSVIHTPEMYVYKPQKSNDTLASAVLIMPGGGYRYLSMYHEGVDVANWFNKRGIVAVILKSRLPDDRLMTHKEIVPLTDAKQALKILKDKAKTYGINPNKIGVMGFSAGGHLAATLSTRYDKDVKPAFSILIYPVISMANNLTHSGSRNVLLGEQPDEGLIEKYSNEKQVTVNTPPAFLVHASNDTAVPYQNSLTYYQNLIEKGIKQSELHIFPSGGHGFWMAKGLEGTVSQWPLLLESWLKDNNWLNY